MTSEIHGLNTGDNFDIHHPQTDLTTYQRAPYYFGIKLFNHLPLNKLRPAQAYHHCRSPAFKG
jgi:hypothetical protein